MIVVISAILLVGGTAWAIVANRAPNSAIAPATTPLNPRIGEALAPDLQPPPAVAVAPRGESAVTAPTPSPIPRHAQRRSRPPAARIYRNTNLGFSVLLAANWVAGIPSSPATQVFFSNQTGTVNYGTVEVFENQSGDTIDSLEQILEATPHVSGLERVSYRSHIGLGYHTNNSTAEHFVFVVNGKIYYVHGGEELLTRVNFI